MAKINRDAIAERPAVSEEDNEEVAVVVAPKFIRKGWINTTKPKTYRKTVTGVPYLDLRDGNKHIVKLLDDEPAAAYMQHFVNSTHKYFTCIEEWHWEDEQRGTGKVVDVHCPLCDEGHRAKPRYMMNAVDISTDKDVVVKWEFGNEVYNTIKKKFIPAKEGETAFFFPLDREDAYFHIYQVDVPGRTAKGTEMDGLRSKYLDDWQKEPLTPEQVEKLKSRRYGQEVIWISNEKDIQEAADRLTDNDL